MSSDLMAGRYCKHQNQTKKFLEEACTLIELGNIVERVRLGHLKLCEPCICSDNIYTCKKTGRESADERAFAAWLLSEARHQAPRRPRPTLSHSRAAKCITKTNEAKPYEAFNLKKKTKCKLQCLHSEVHKDSNRLNREPEKCSRKRQSLPPCSKKDKNVPTKVKERRIKRQLEASNTDMAKYMQYLLKDLSSHVNSGKTSIALLPKKDYSKYSLNTWKSFSSFSDACLFNKACMKQNTNKKDTADGIGKRQLIKSAASKPSLQLKMNIRLNPNSNTMNLLIKSRQGMCRSAKSNPDAIHFRLPFQCGSSVNKLSTNFSSSLLTERSVQTPSAQTSKNREIQFLKPYAKTQAVYQVYDIAPYQQPTGKMKGIRSHVSFNVNIGRPPQTEGRMYADEGRPLTAPPSGRLAGNRKVLYNNKVNFDSGSTSMQQSFSLGRSDPQLESPYETDDFSRICDCANSGRSSVLGTQQSDAPVCDTCCQANAFQRTRQRIIDRVGTLGTDPLGYGRSMIFSPLVFLKKCYDKYICNKVEEQTKSVGSCTCSPFIETEQFTVQEGNVNPECSFLKRSFGQLIFSNKCVVCTEEKRVGTKYRPLKTYECEPGTCVEKKDFLACFKKFCKKKKPKTDDKKKAKTKTDKEKAKKAKKRAQKKKLKAKEKKKSKKKRKREKVKGTSLLSFITSVFKNPEEDDDRQKLLSDEGKRKHKNGDDKEKGKEGQKTELEDKAKKTLATTRRGYRRITRRIRERYYRNKKLAEEQKGQYACDFYLMSLRTKPCLWVYYMCPVCYPYCLQLLNTWRQVSDLLLFFVAIIVWSPCILCAECLKIVACNMCVS